MAIPHNPHKDFEDFLMNEFTMGDGHCVLDDDLPDAFDAWIQNLEIDDWLRYGDKYFKTGLNIPNVEV